MMEENIYRMGKELNDLVSKLKQDSRKIVFTNGVFDILHRGHIEYLTEAKKLGDLLIVGLNSDSSVKIIKGANRPIVKESDRAFVLVNVKPVDYVVIFDEANPFNLIKTVLPDVLVKGGDWKPQDIIGSDIVLEHGGKVLSLNYIDNYSTSGIIQKIAET